MARSSVTYRQIAADARMMLGVRDQNIPPPKEVIRYINYSMFTLHNLLDGLYDAWEKTSATLTRNVGGVTAAFGLDTDVISYVASTKRVTNAAGHGLTSSFVGGLILMYDISLTRGYVGIVDSIVSATVFQLLRDPTSGTNIVATDGAYAIIAPPWYSEGATLTGLSPTVKRLNAVHDATYGNLVRLSPGEFETADVNDNIAGSGNPNFSDSIGMFEFAEGVFWKNGSNITTLNAAKTAYYNADPLERTAITDTVDLESEHHAMIVKDVARQIELRYPTEKKTDGRDPFEDLRKLYAAGDAAFINKKFSLEEVNVG